LGLVLGGCPADTGGGCKGDGGCYYFRSNDDYKWCGDKNCAIWESPDAGQTSLHCDCD
jgi:hypothetical protein